MGKSLGDYNVEKSSSSDVKNIKWTQKNPINVDKPKKKERKKISPTNIIHTQKNNKVNSSVEKVFKVEEGNDAEKSKDDKTGKKFQNSSASNCKIKQGFTRPGR